MQIDFDFSTDKLKSMSEAVRVVMKNYHTGYRFYGYELHDDVSRIYPKAKKMYPDTLMRMMRRYCSDQYKTIDKNKSLYEKVGS